MTISIIKNSLKKSVNVLAVALILFCLWDFIALCVGEPYFMPTVSQTFTALFSLLKTKGFIKLVLKSLLKVAIGLISGISFGVILATVSHILPISNSLISPIISIMKATPVATIILMLWFTLSDSNLAIFVVFLMVTPVIWQNVYDGYKSISKDMREVCEIFEFSYFKKIKMLIFPTVIKYLIPAIITSMGLAWKAEIAAEIMTYSNIGRSITDFKTLYHDTPSVFAWAMVIITLNFALEGITKSLLKRIKI